MVFSHRCDPQIEPLDKTHSSTSERDRQRSLDVKVHSFGLALNISNINFDSHEANTSYGAPQGSVLGPVNIYEQVCAARCTFIRYFILLVRLQRLYGEEL